MSAAPEKRAPSAELRARVLADVAMHPSPTRSAHRSRVAMVATAGALATTGLFFAMGGFARGTRPLELVAFTAGVGLFAALVMTRVSTGGRSMLGRPRVALLVACIALAPLLACAALASNVLWPSGEDVPGHAHVACAAITLLQGALPLAVLLLPRQGTDPVHPAITGAALGMTAGAWTAMMAYLRCPHAPAGHCIVAHVLPTLVLTALGAVLGRFLLRLR